MSKRRETVEAWVAGRGFKIGGDDFDDVLNAVDGLVDALGQYLPGVAPFEITESFHACLQACATAPRLSVNQDDGRQGVSDNVSKTAHHDPLSPRERLNIIRNHPLGALAWVELFDDFSPVPAVPACKAEHGRPLDGVSVGLKDMFELAGRAPTFGTGKARTGSLPDRDALLVERLRHAGAHILGMQHMAEYALSPTGLNVHLGPGRNPLNPEYVSGGSSSGAGMAVGAGHVLVSIGSDTGGSVRLPAGFCGAVGLKPTQYRTPLQGVMPLAPSLDCVGPIARNASLCAAAYAALVDGADPDIHPEANGTINLETYALPPVTVALPELQQGPAVSARMVDAVRETAASLRALGVKVITVPLPDLDLPGKLGSIILGGESSALHRQGLARNPEQYGHQVRRRLSRGLLVSAIDYYDAVRIRGAVLKRFISDGMKDADILLLPLAPDIPPLVSDSMNAPERVLEQRFSTLSFWTRGINYLGLPALAMPVKETPEGIPLAVQLVGKPLSEMHLLVLAHHLQKVGRCYSPH